MTFIGIGEWPAKRASLSPNATALVDRATGRRFSYREWDLRVRALAGVLSGRFGVVPGDRVALLAANSLEYLEAVFAVAQLGAISVPLNWRLTASELSTILLRLRASPAPARHDLRRQRRRGHRRGGAAG